MFYSSFSIKSSLRYTNECMRFYGLPPCLYWSFAFSNFWEHLLPALQDEILHGQVHSKVFMTTFHSCISRIHGISLTFVLMRLDAHFFIINEKFARAMALSGSLIIHLTNHKDTREAATKVIVFQKHDSRVFVTPSNFCFLVSEITVICQHVHNIFYLLFFLHADSLSSDASLHSLKDDTTRIVCFE